MIYAIISDIHANAEALRRVIADAREHRAEKIVSLGDIVGYGPLPADALALIRNTASIILAGNHDDAVSGRRGAEDFNGLAGEAVERHRAALSRRDLAWLRQLPYTAELEDAVCTHGDIADPPGFGYIDSDERAAENFQAFSAQVLFVGHTHIPCFHLTGTSGRVYRLEADDFVLEDGKRYIVNVGSVGYPRESNGVCLSTYVLYDTEAKTIRFRKLPFSVGSILPRGRTWKRSHPFAMVSSVLILFILVATAFILPHWRSTAPTSPVSAAQPVTSQPFAERTLALTTAGTRYVRANLTLARGSPSAILTVAFVNAAGERSERLVKTVRRSNREQVPVPPEAVEAVFTLRSSATGQEPKISSFAPTGEH